MVGIMRRGGYLRELTCRDGSPEAVTVRTQAVGNPGERVGIVEVLSVLVSLVVSGFLLLSLLSFLSLSSLSLFLFGVVVSLPDREPLLFCYY